MIALWVLGALALGTLIYSFVGLYLDRDSIDWQTGYIPNVNSFDPSNR